MTPNERIEAVNLAVSHIENAVERGYPDCKRCGTTMEPAQFDDEKTIWCSSCAYAVLDVVSRALVDTEQRLEFAIGPHCNSCGNPIDPDCCWCGDGPANKHYDETHGFIPMGCDCCRADRDWKKLAGALRERVYQLSRVADLESLPHQIAAFLESRGFGGETVNAIRDGSWNDKR